MNSAWCFAAERSVPDRENCRNCRRHLDVRSSRATFLECLDDNYADYESVRTIYESVRTIIMRTTTDPHVRNRIAEDRIDNSGNEKRERDEAEKIR